MLRSALGVPSGLAALVGFLLAATPVGASPPAAPVDVQLVADGASLRWRLAAARDVSITGSAWRSVPAGALAGTPVVPTWLAAGTTASGQIGCRQASGWIELELAGSSASGPFAIGATARWGAPAGDAPLRVVPRPAKALPGAVGASVAARVVYADRLVDARGYTGTTQLLPLRFADAALLEVGHGALVARGSLDADGRLQLVLAAPPAGPVVLQLVAATRNQPSVRLVVLDPQALDAEALRRARPHAIESAPFTVDSPAVDLGTLVLRDADGTGRVQAFHILDVALDAWSALADTGVLGSTPGPADSLRFIWGPSLPIRGTAYGGGIVQVASPASGDTDGWSDAILLHEIGHFVASRWLDDRNPGGIHLLGDVEQDLRLAWSEGSATAFACWVRAQRASRTNLDGEPIDLSPELFVNVALPPPDGSPGGLQYAWDVERNTLGDLPLRRDGTGSETNVAGLLWDAIDDAATGDGTPADDDSTVVAQSALWAALGGVGAIQARDGATFEDFYRSWCARDPGGARLGELLRAAHIEYATDAAEPDADVAAPLPAWQTVAAVSGVVLSEIVPGPRIAVEIVNRTPARVDLGGWRLVARSNTSSTNPALTTTLPAGLALGPGGRVVVRRGAVEGADLPRDVVARDWTVPWFPGVEGACMLLDAQGRGIDFVRWNSLDGTPSTIAPPAGTGWSGEVAAAAFGASLARRADVPDRDQADDFVAGEPTLGAPNDAGAIHRSFFPQGDVDRLLLAVPHDGVYTLATRRLRSGAMPALELWRAGALRPLVTVLPDAARAGTAALTLQIAAAETLEVRCRQAGSTRYGSYDLAFFAEPDAALPVSPRIVRTGVQLTGTRAVLEFEWRNAARYDSITVHSTTVRVALPGPVMRTAIELPVGRHAVELVAYAGALAAPPVRMLVAAEPWTAVFSEPFDSLRTGLWERRGDWAPIELAGRRGRVLALAPSGAYPDQSASWLRLRSAIVPGPAAVLHFEHVCIVRPEDHAELEITDDWGASWQSLGRWDWNAHRGEGEMADWHDGVADSTDWVAEERPLAAWAGRPVQIRWRFESDIHGRAAGWFIDGLAIDAAPPAFQFVLGANVPNPFNPSTTLHFDINQPARVRLAVYDARGRLVRLLVDETRPAGPQTVVWNGIDGDGGAVASGVYFAAADAAGEHRSRRLVLIR